MNESDSIAATALQLEALLFVLGRPVGKDELCETLSVSLGELQQAILHLQGTLRGIVAVDDGKTVELRASAAAAEIIEKVRQEEYARDMGRAGLETIAAILYKGPLSRSAVDFIRGVNSSQILRTLTMRGYLRKIQNPKDERSFLYEPTTELLSHLGIENKESLPEFAELQGKIDALEQARLAQTQEPSSHE
jgi:segregation and condensation protein B